MKGCSHSEVQSLSIVCPPSYKSLQLSSFIREMEIEKENHTQEFFFFRGGREYLEVVCITSAHFLLLGTQSHGLF